MDHHAWNGPSYQFVEVMKRAEEEFVKYGTTEAMKAHRDHDGPSRGPSPSRVLTYFQ